MKNKFWNKRIPTLFGILIITIGVAVTTFLVNQGVLLKSNAMPTEQPQNVRITNITDNSFSVSYETDSQVIGSLNYGKDNKLGQQALDDRDQQTGSLASHSIHNITARDLDPQTKYYFSITSGQNNYTNGDKLFEVITGSNISDSPPNQNPIGGKITLIDGTAPKEAIIYVTADNSQVVSTLAKADGTYILPLNALRTNDLASYYTFPASGIIKMLILGDSLTSNASLSINQINPIPTIILSKNYDFKQSQSSTQIIPDTSTSFPSFSSTSSASQILVLKKNQEFTDQKPVFKGAALPDETVNITIHSDQAIQATVKTDTKGNWNYRPTSNLTPGNHTITVQTKNSLGILQTITQSFVVYASGQQDYSCCSIRYSYSNYNSYISSYSYYCSKNFAYANSNPNWHSCINSSTISPILTQAQTKGGNAISPTEKSLPPTGNPSIITAGIIGAAITTVGSLLLLLAL
jgi:hypothetical protein